MPTNRPSFLQGEDVEFTVDVDSKYITDAESMYAYVYYDDYHNLSTRKDSSVFQMEADAENSSVRIHISNSATANPDVMPVGIWSLEIMSVNGETNYRSIYQNTKQFAIKKSYIAFSEDIYINKSIKMNITKLNNYRGETITLSWKGDDTYTFPSDGTVKFKTLVYPDGMDMSVSQNRQEFLREIDSRDVKTGQSAPTPQYGDGYVFYDPDVANTAFCVIPWEKTVDMKTGQYTVELLYGDDSRSVVTKNNAFTLVASVSEYVDENYDTDKETEE